MADQKTEDMMEKDLQTFKNWVKDQPQLPDDLGDKLIHRFLHSCYYDIEQAKSAITLFSSIRCSIPDILSNRDPHSAKMQKCLNIINLAQLNISGNRNLWIWQLNDPGLLKYDYTSDVKLFFLSTDAWLLNDEKFQESDSTILDVKDMSLKILAKINIALARKLSKYQEGAIPIRLNQVHVVNAPSIIDKIFSLMKPFFSQKIIDAIHFHPANSETLYKYFDKSDLPEDYGGTAGKMEDHMKDIRAMLDKHRDRLIDENLWKSKDIKKSKNKKQEESKNDESLVTEETNFRSLAID